MLANILLVEDEKSIVTLIKYNLEKEGFKVFCSETGEDALKIIKEKTNMFEFKFNELTLTDEQTQSQIDERYLKTQVVVPNEIRQRIGLPMRAGGQDPVQLTSQQRADNTAQIAGNRARDTERNNNSTFLPKKTLRSHHQGEIQICLESHQNYFFHFQY